MSKDNVVELVEKDGVYEDQEKEPHKQTVIIAPHPDDEIIGCYEILNSSENPIIIYSGNTDVKRRNEAMKLKEYINIKAQIFLMSVPPNLINENSVFYFPDPVYETHPIHRQYGMMGEQFAREGFDVTFYTTNMNAPYIHESTLVKEKEELLNNVYPSQKSLWEYDKKYVLFEGYCKWIF
jgi:hypothetical protein